jgi:hypothetical protein
VGEIIDFPSQPEERPARHTLNIEAEGPPLPEMCGGVMHIFDEVPGTCRCGVETWTPEGLLDPGDNAIGIHHVA